VTVDLDLGPSSPAIGRGTITLVDYGADGSDLAVPFVRPNQTAAVRIGAVRSGRAYVACAVDHRAVDGADVGRFLATFKAGIESRTNSVVTLSLSKGPPQSPPIASIPSAR